MLKRTAVAMLLCLSFAQSVLACLWDRDTPQDEALDMPEVVAALTGRFERNPPLYYEMRLARVEEYLQDHPEDLAACDDAGVACDRLGRGDEAIVWMEWKLNQMQSENTENQKHLLISLAYMAAAMFAIPLMPKPEMPYSPIGGVVQKKPICEICQTRQAHYIPSS